MALTLVKDGTTYRRQGKKSYTHFTT